MIFMNPSRRLGVYFLFFFTAVFAKSLPVLATMQDEVLGISKAEVFQAATDVANSFSAVHKKKPEKGYLETQWKEDSVRRSRGMFKKILYQQYQRRTRLKINIDEIKGGVSLKVKGVFQDRPEGAGGNVPWKTVRMDAQDHRLEREIFFKILTRIQEIHQAAIHASTAD